MIISVCIIMIIKWTHPIIKCADQTHRYYITVTTTQPALYEMEWIYILRTKVSGPESLELALEMKQRKKENLHVFFFFRNFLFRHTVKSG